MSKQDFLPVILGADDNAYGVARAFHEEYGIKSVVLTKGNLLATMHSKIVDKIFVDDLNNPDIFADNLLSVWPQLNEQSDNLLVLSCNENYAELCIRNKEKLKDKFILPYINEDQMEEIIYKENFYKMCEEYDLDYPATVIFKKGMNPLMELPFDYPVVVKPSDSVTYFNAQFEGKEKAYILKTKEEFVHTIETIYNSEYTDALIVQDYIPGGDDTMRVLNAYVDEHHKVRLMVLGHIVLEDCTPELLGNYVAILPDYNEDLYKKYTDFLEKIKFTGFANIDLKYDRRDGKYKIFELNIRQGRSSYFVTASGYNLMKPLVEDRVYHKENTPVYGNGDVLWHTVPLDIVEKYVKDSELKAKVEELVANNKTASTLYYNKDLSFIKRMKLNKFYKNYYSRFEMYFDGDK